MHASLLSLIQRIHGLKDQIGWRYCSLVDQVAWNGVPIREEAVAIILSHGYTDFTNSWRVWLPMKYSRHRLSTIFQYICGIMVAVSVERDWLEWHTKGMRSV